MQLGRSERFLNRLLPAVRERFGDRPAFSQDNFVAWNQQVKPGFIRVDADEVRATRRMSSCVMKLNVR